MAEIKLQWVSISDRKCLKFIFDGDLDASSAAAAIKKWKAEFADTSLQKIPVIFDCTKMAGYDNDARIMWQEIIKELKPRIDSLWLISTSNLIRIGASAMSIFSSIKIKSAASEKDIKLAPRS